MAFSNQLSVTVPSQSISRVQATGDRQRFTIAAWVKRGTIGTAQQICGFGDDGGPSNSIWLGFNTSNAIVVSCFTGGTPPSGNGTLVISLASTETIADTTTWHHVCLAIDTTQATPANRAHLYVDGTEVHYAGTPTYPALNTLCQKGGTWYWGRLDTQAINLFNGKFDELYYIDGAQLTPSAFISGHPGVPIQFAGVYGVQGSVLRFENAAALGADSSGNLHNWTVSASITSSSDAVAVLGLPDANALATSSPTLGAPGITQHASLFAIAIQTSSPAIAVPLFRQRQIFSGVSLITGAPVFAPPNSRIFKTASLGLGYTVTPNSQFKGPFFASDGSSTAVELMDGASVPGPFSFSQVLVAQPNTVYEFAIEAQYAGRFVEIGIFDGGANNRAFAIIDPRDGRDLFKGTVGDTSIRLVGTRQEETFLGFRRLIVAASVNSKTGFVGGYVTLNNANLINNYVGDGISGAILCKPKMIFGNADQREFPQMIGAPEMRFYWTVHVGTVALRWFRASKGQAGVDHHLEFGRALDLECVLNRWKPAHTQIVFDYSGLESGTGDPLAGTP